MANHPDATFPLAPALTTSGSLRDAPPLVLAAASAAKVLAVPRGWGAETRLIPLTDFPDSTCDLLRLWATMLIGAGPKVPSPSSE